VAFREQIDRGPGIDIGVTMPRAQPALLLVMADPALEDLMVLIREHDDWIVHVSSTMDEAIAELSTHKYELVITGPNTAASEDLTFYERIRKTEPEIKLIALCFERERSDVIEAILKHAFSYFTSPFSAESICRMIGTALEAADWKDGIEVLSNRPHWLALRVSSCKVTAERLVQFVRELESDLSEADRGAIQVAFREILLNAMEHGGGFDPASKVELSFVRTSRMIFYQLRDPGPGFSMDRLPHSAISNPEENPFGHVVYRDEHDMRPGGLGILMTRQLVDDLLYNEKGNEVLLIKYLDADPSPVIKTNG
jgi:anti-sigma regulatory factor (Ser/Thr protein kinase)/CheY-like chemotaxis protein